VDGAATETSPMNTPPVTRRILWATLIIAALAAAAVRTDAGANVVELRLLNRYFTAPATVWITIVVEPDEANRTLRVEMDGERMFRASALKLEGASEKRLHEIQFKDVPAGQYRLSATVLSAVEVRGTARQNLNVVGLPPR